MSWRMGFTIGALPLLMGASMPSCLQLPQWGEWEDVRDYQTGEVTSVLTPRLVRLVFRPGVELSRTPGCDALTAPDVQRLGSGLLWQPLEGGFEVAGGHPLRGDVSWHLISMDWLGSKPPTESAVFPVLVHSGPSTFWYFPWRTTWYGNPISVDFAGRSHAFIWLTIETHPEVIAGSDTFTLAVDGPCVVQWSGSFEPAGPLGAHAYWDLPVTRGYLRGTLGES